MKIYKLHSNQVWGYAFTLSMITLGLLTISFTLILLPFLSSESLNLDLIVAIGLTILFIVAATVFIYVYCNTKSANLIVDEEGIRTSSKLLNHMPNLTPLRFDDGSTFYIIDNYSKSLLAAGRLAELSNDKNNSEVTDKTLIIIDRHHNSKKMPTAVSNNMWQITDMSELQDYLNQLGFTVASIPAKDFIEQYISHPYLDDIGKRAGYAAYSAIAFAAISILIFVLDYHTTTQDTPLGTWFLILTVLSFFSVLCFIRTHLKQVLALIIVASIFSTTFSLMIVISLLALTPILGNKQQVDFSYKDFNEYESEEWVGIDPSTNKEITLTIRCDESNGSRNIENATERLKVYQLFNITRVNANKLCPNNGLLNIFSPKNNSRDKKVSNEL